MHAYALILKVPFSTIPELIIIAGYTRSTGGTIQLCPLKVV
ncbi:hypothetical protein L195_g038005 [Trifolium pratense]|uniref:Uncharacterized protein n=1 Tax=Trifolium pratense TaxID=57577 RepID=A0A2K3LTZ1_TRIPR|nr:hypothetical protein L195_g038005 [Trifolium pratense]